VVVCLTLSLSHSPECLSHRNMSPVEFLCSRRLASCDQDGPSVPVVLRVYTFLVVRCRTPPTSSPFRLCVAAAGVLKTRIRIESSVPRGPRAIGCVGTWCATRPIHPAGCDGRIKASCNGCVRRVVRVWMPPNVVRIACKYIGKVMRRILMTRYVYF
jgi:hypothetical protein